MALLLTGLVAASLPVACAARRGTSRLDSLDDSARLGHADGVHGLGTARAEEEEEEVVDAAAGVARRAQSSATCPTPDAIAQWTAQGLTLSPWARQKSNGRAYVTCTKGTSREQKVSCLPEECGGDPWCFVPNGCGSWLFSCSKMQVQSVDLPCVSEPEQRPDAFCPGSPPQRCRMLCPQRPSCPQGQCVTRVDGCCSFQCTDPSKQEVLPLEAWALVGLTNFSVAPGLGDWFSESDIYAEVKVQPSARKYESKTFWNTDAGSLDMYFFVPQSELSLEIAIHDVDLVTGNDLIGSCEIPVYSGGGEFEGTLKVQHGSEAVFGTNLKEVGTLKGYVAKGEAAVRRAHDALIVRGVQPIFGDPEQGSRYGVVQVSNDNMEHELAWARTGSIIPEGLHGIWWMDQRGKHLPIPSDPEYKQECESAGDELLQAFGEGSWNPESLCLENHWVWGGSPRGHWVFMNDGHGHNKEWGEAFTTKAKIDFCFRDATFQAIDLKVLVKAGDVLEQVVGINLDEAVDGFIELPREMISMNMIKKPWGWDRETVVGPHVGELRKALTGDWWSFLDDYHQVCHYPVFQIVDGDGERTEHYDAYLAWANTNFPDCKESTFDCPLSNGKGTSLVPRLIG